MADETPADSTPEVLREEDAGFNKALRPRQIQMIAIGTGLFMGAGGRLAAAGPALVLVYAVCAFSRSW